MTEALLLSFQFELLFSLNYFYHKYRELALELNFSLNYKGFSEKVLNNLRFGSRPSPRGGQEIIRITKGIV